VGLPALHSITTIMISALLIFTACEDHGLAPTAPEDQQSQEPGFGGRILVKSAWSPPDSLIDLRVVAFRNYPPGNIIEEVAAERAIISETLNFNQDTLYYKINTGDLSETFQYITVAQRYADNITLHWRAVGVYTLSGDPDAPSSVVLNGSNFVPDVNIEIDFYNLPPQPF
jgi:hypothetical protein